MRISFSLCRKLPRCFKEEIFGCAFQPGGIRRTFDKPPPRQLTLPLWVSSGAFKMYNSTSALLSIKRNNFCFEKNKAN